MIELSLGTAVALVGGQVIVAQFVIWALRTHRETAAYKRRQGPLGRPQSFFARRMACGCTSEDFPALRGWFFHGPRPGERGWSQCGACDQQWPSLPDRPWVSLVAGGATYDPSSPLVEDMPASDRRPAHVRIPDDPSRSGRITRDNIPPATDAVENLLAAARDSARVLQRAGRTPGHRAPVNTTDVPEPGAVGWPADYGAYDRITDGPVNETPESDGPTAFYAGADFVDEQIMRAPDRRPADTPKPPPRDRRRRIDL
jgi:hypothetical protein